ncbi:hypothetical protein LUZ60_013856 [Juncus effusus]|nr:hypothetical protein LUZ60_013856 [Juncus effusus]
MASSQIQIPNSNPLPELASYSTVSTTSDSSSPEHILNLPKSQSPNLPPIQHMNRSNYDVPDPNRIPQSIFASNKSSAPTEWSVASNESLFSIQLAKSGELGNIFGNHPELLQIGIPKEVIGGMKDGISGPLMELDVGQIQGREKEKGQSQNSNYKEKVEMSVNVNMNPTRGQIGNFSNMSTPCESPASGVSGRISETSTNSHSSFAFPLLTGEANAKVSHGRESMQKLLIQKEPVPVGAVPETPETVKSPPPQNGSWFSCFPCCTFTR